MTRHWTLFGFVSLLFAPLIVFELSLALGPVAGGFPPVAIAALYPLTLVVLVFSPLAFRPGSYESPEAGVNFAKGARYALWTTVIIAFPFALILGTFYGQFLIGLSLLLIAFGSISLVDMSVAGTYGYLLVKGDGVDEFFSRATKWLLSREMRIIFWLSLLLRRRDVLKGLSVVGNYAVLPLLIYFLGWVLLSFAGGFPATILGVILGLLVPISSYISISRRLKPEDREKLASLLVSRTAKSFRTQTLPVALK